MKIHKKTTKYCHVRVTLIETIEMPYDCPLSLAKEPNGEYHYQKHLKENAVFETLRIIQQIELGNEAFKQLNYNAEIL